MHKHERGHVHKHDIVHLTRSQSDRKDKVAKSFTDDVRDRNSRSSNENGKERDKNKHSRKRVKEFKLHRFLALAPNAEGQKTNPLIISPRLYLSVSVIDLPIRPSETLSGESKSVLLFELSLFSAL
jgi:hypothetical protein